MSQPSAKLARAREAFIHSVRRRALRLVRLEGHAEEPARRILQSALAQFLPQSRQLAPGDWTACWWRLLLAALPAEAGGDAFGAVATADWQRDWDRLPLIERRAFLLQAWLRLPRALAAQALGVPETEAARRLALASLHLRRAAESEPDEPRRLARLCDALEHAALASTQAEALAPITAARRGLGAGVRAVLGLAGVLLLLTGGFLSWPRSEPLPTDLVLPEGASGLVPARVGPALLPEDAARLADPDWPLWAEPEQAALIADLEFHAWLAEQADAR